MDHSFEAIGPIFFFKNLKTFELRNSNDRSKFFVSVTLKVDAKGVSTENFSKID